MKILPIVPGCRALYLGSPSKSTENIPACEVRVTGRYANPKVYGRCRVCGSRAEDTAWMCEGIPSSKYNGTCECRLLRIDGYKVEDEEKEVAA